jgi:hypothetical protein
MNMQKLSMRRHKIYQLKAKREELERLAQAHDNMVAGSLVERRFRPNGPAAYYLSIPTEHNSWHRYIRKDELEHFRIRAEAWRKFVHAMARWVLVNKAIEKELRSLGRERCEKIAIRRGRGK